MVEKDKDLTKKENKVKLLDANTIIMIICLAFIFSLTILNKTGILTNWILYVLLVVFLAIMIYVLIASIKKNKEISKELEK
jgi:L-asparagine transporter-like permease